MKNMFGRVIIAIFTFVMLGNAFVMPGQLAVPALATPQAYMRQNIERRLNEANTYFAQNDFEMGASRIREVCSLLKSAPQCMPELNYLKLAAEKALFIDGKLRAALDKHNYDSARVLVRAEDNLLTSLSDWEPQNPRWHYEKAVLFHINSALPMTGAGAAIASRMGIQNNLHNELDMRPLQDAINECDRALGLSDQSYREKATKLKNACNAEIQRRNSKINAFHQEYYRKLPKGMPPPGMSSSAPSSTEHYCSKCGGGHESWICPFTHGG